MPVNDQKEELSLDARLLSDAIIEINILRHKATLYPEGHPSLEEALRRVLELLQDLFELRPEITLKVAKDVLIIDESYLDKKNPIYKEFALSLSAKTIAYLTFSQGLTKEELFTFYQFISKDFEDASPEAIQEDFKGCNTPHVTVGFVDYSAFSFKEGEIEDGDSEKHLWEKYVQLLFEGTLQKEEEYSAISEIPPEVFAHLVNETATDSMSDETYERVITTYVRRSTEKTLLSRDLRKLVKFINRLRPELKKQFLSSSFKSFSQDLSTADEILRDIPADEAIELLNSINEQKITIPEAIKNLLEKLSMLTPEGFEGRTSGELLIVDDIPLSENITTMLSEDDFNNFVTDTYSKEIQALLTSDISAIGVEEIKEFEEEWCDEHLEKEFNQTLLELISADGNNLITDDNSGYFNNLLKDQIEHFIGTGQYDQVLKIVSTIKSREDKQEDPQEDSSLLSPESIAHLVDSFRIVGSQNKGNAKLLCEYCSEQLVTPLIEALIEEESRKTRRFLLDLVVHLGERAVNAALNHLSDPRWYVKRNMLYILSECGRTEALPHVKPYSMHDNPKVRYQAIRYLVKTERSYAVEVLRTLLSSGVSDRVDMALSVTWAFNITELVPDLITLLDKAAKRGSDFEHKIPIVRALGHLGDSRALPVLKNLLSSRSLLFKGALQKLKDAIKSTLEQYPDSEVRKIMGDKESSPGRNRITQGHKGLNHS
ncbi:HEAT repeat domain-containing protein [bacterium]|nr:MAG: HEAT repeat domain-containing protein [bacterium]